MSRIRSIHPGLWTDEAFMSLSALGRLLYIGIWTEAFDDGVFEWKPLTLKAKLFPVDAVDVPALLGELVDAGVIARLEAHPKKPGVVRNFQRYQRPKKPNSSGMLPDEWREYVGASSTAATSDDDGSEPVGNQSETGGEKFPQMEDGGGREGVKDAKPTASLRATRWQKGQKVPDGWKAWAKTSFPSVDGYKLTTETRQFEEYWPTKLGKEGLRADFEAEYHMWMRRKFGLQEVSDGDGAYPELVVLRPGDDDFRLLEAVRGKPFIMGNSGTVTISVAEVKRAREITGMELH